MHINKYIELLRFYLTEKIGEVNNSLQKTIADEIDNIVSSILSAILAVYISAETLKTLGPWSIVLKVIFVVGLWLMIKFVIWKRIRCWIKSKKEIKASDERQLTIEESKQLVDRFDHVACDGVLLALDFLRMHGGNADSCGNEKRFYLYESFYYYKKALLIVAEAVYYEQHCINNENNNNGISRYRLQNIYSNLLDIQKELQERIDFLMPIDNSVEEFRHDFQQTAYHLEDIKKYLDV